MNDIDKTWLEGWVRIFEPATYLNMSRSDLIEQLKIDLIYMLAEAGVDVSNLKDEEGEEK